MLYKLSHKSVIFKVLYEAELLFSKQVDIFSFADRNITQISPRQNFADLPKKAKSTKTNLCKLNQIHQKLPKKLC